MSKKIYIISLIVFIIDQITKSIISTYIKLNDSIQIIKDFFYIRYINKHGLINIMKSFCNKYSVDFYKTTIQFNFTRLA